jgi:xyloglucan-specific endo-beta-1,4-glucanase
VRRNLYYGSNGANYVYSFLPTSGTVTAFSGDVNAFLKYLTSNGKIAGSQYLTTFQAGTEATTGSKVTFTTYAPLALYAHRGSAYEACRTAYSAAIA